MKGKKLEVALSGCKTNMVESIEELRELADEENKEEFEKAIPQAMIRTALLKALKKDPGVERQEKASDHFSVQPKEYAGNP